VNIKNCDIDADLRPDIVSDVRALPIENNKFDLVVAYEILEHLPFDDFKKALEELKRVSKEKVIISLPYPSVHLEFFLKFKFVFLSKKIVQKIFVVLKIPYFLKKIDINKNKQHYWEIGTKGYPKKRVERILRNIFKEVESPKIILDSYHKFYILKK
jgi:ubiquinone/menaquinone biosynthesis C-methylase UbiE